MITSYPATKEAYQLLHDGTLALAAAEQRGMRIDVAYCENQSERLGRKIEYLENSLLTHDPEVQEWKKKYRGKTNLGSDEQLADMLFNVLGYESKKQTASGLESTDKLALAEIDSPMVKELLQLRAFQKTKGTYIDGILKEQVNGILRPSFSVSTTDTYRSSSSNINFQNQPVRDPVMARLIRRAFIPRKDHLIVEPDYSGVEVKVAACYHKDPVMLDYLLHGKDMHGDMAEQIYCLPSGIGKGQKWFKNVRYCAKNKFIFPQFYGDWYRTCATSLWDAIDQMELSYGAVGMKKHLSGNKIKNYQKFEEHLKEVEYDFWHNRFGVYGKWKEDHYKLYVKNGYVESLTGFRYQGYMRKNQVINYPVQGSAFHCLLKAMIEVTRIAKNEKWKSGPIGQIHDSMPTEVHKDEYSHVITTIEQVMSEFVPKAFPWLIVPLDIEVESSPIEGSWFLKKQITSGPSCPKCHNHWMYELKDKDSGQLLIWDCPVCRNRLDISKDNMN